MFSISAYAQNEVTKFMGIPIDGNKNEMISKLKNKGFKWNSRNECLEGEFNGQNVFLHIITNKNKVYRILVEETYSYSESEIKIRFNSLCKQFEKNKRYKSAQDDSFIIGDDENISYEMNVNNKRYEAAYYQFADNDDRMIHIGGDGSIKGLDLFKRSVWFMIHEHYGRYHILLFYDNEYNQANGEDL